jgi:hypothetical protein
MAEGAVGDKRESSQDQQGPSGPAPRGAMDPRLCPPARHSRRIYRPGRRAARGLDAFFEAFAALAPAEVERRFAAADRHLREAGVTYRAPGETADRLWPLSHLPLLIDEADWQQLTAGIAQRARTARTGAARPLWRGPAGRRRRDAGGGDRRQQRISAPVCGVKPPGGRYLNLYAADVGRGPDGRWWVLNDRTQAPSGAGYALENRLVLSRAFSISTSR